MSGTSTPDTMDKPPERRKLIAVVYADAVGYSRLIGLDDVGTLQRLRTLRRILIDPAIAEHGGRIVNTGGDSLLMVFDSIDGAVRCAAKVQQQVPAHDGDHPPDRPIRFRVGINVGDVIPDGTDVHGDVVNVAARLQAECPPGGICVSRAVRDHVQDRLDLAFEELGLLKLKNISRPVEAFVLRLDAGATPESLERSPLHDTPDALPLPDRPSIAVLAFDNMSGDPDQEYLADGFADNVIIGLSRNRSLFVIARTSSFTYKGRSIVVKQVAAELGVRYVVEGSVQRSSNRLRITVQLIDANTGTPIWAERFDRDLADLFSVQDDITNAIVAAIDPAISQVEQQRATQKPPENLSAWEAWQRALWHWSKGGDLSTRRDFLQRAVALDPHFAPTHAMLVWLYLSESTRGVDPPLREGEQLAEAEARIALDLDAYSAIAHSAQAWVFEHQGDRVAALEEAEIAITLNPNDSHGYLIKGRILVMSGHPVEAREPLATALRIDPSGPTAPAVMHNRVVGCYFQQDYLAAEETARRTIRAYPEHPSISRPYLWLAAALGQLGRTAEAHTAMDAAIAASPSYFKYKTDSRAPYMRPRDHEHLLDGLRKAGWQG
jgi:adenylate cyclase